MWFDMIVSKAPAVQQTLSFHLNTQLRWWAVECLQQLIDWQAAYGGLAKKYQQWLRGDLSTG
jgi:hypothetical protein